MSHQIVAEIVGNVMSVLTPEGTSVREGDTILILESMKMEIPVLTEFGGVVTNLYVLQGDVVHEGDVLAVIDPTLA